MAFPHDQDGAGDIKSLKRAAWAGVYSNSKYLAIIGGSAYPTLVPTWDGDYGNTKFNWDQPEGWMQRLDFYGTTEKKPFDSISGGQDGSVSWVAKSSLTNLARTNTTGGITTGTTATVIKLVNSGDNSDEVYTNRYNNVDLKSVPTFTPPDGQWYLSFYARRSSLSPACTASVYIFGVSGVNSNYSFVDYITESEGNASSSTITSPATGNTFYRIDTSALTTSWVKYDMCFKFDGQTTITAMTCRLDNNNGDADTDTIIYFDRITLHPMDVAISDVKSGFGSNVNMDQTNMYGPYYS
jgi:hypothetical protein